MHASGGKVDLLNGHITPIIKRWGLLAKDRLVKATLY